MTCSTNGGGCRVCPGIWVAGAVLLFMLAQNFLAQNFFLKPFTPASDSSTPRAAQQVDEPAEGTR